MVPFSSPLLLFFFLSLFPRTSPPLPSTKSVPFVPCRADIIFFFVFMKCQKRNAVADNATRSWTFEKETMMRKIKENIEMAPARTLNFHCVASTRLFSFSLSVVGRPHNWRRRHWSLVPKNKEIIWPHIILDHDELRRQYSTWHGGSGLSFLACRNRNFIHSFLFPSIAHKAQSTGRHSFVLHGRPLVPQ